MSCMYVDSHSAFARRQYVNFPASFGKSCFNEKAHLSGRKPLYPQITVWTLSTPLRCSAQSTHARMLDGWSSHRTEQFQKEALQCHCSPI